MHFYQIRQSKKNLNLSDDDQSIHHKKDSSINLRISQQNHEQNKIDFQNYIYLIVRIQKNYRKFRINQQKKRHETYKQIIKEAYQNEKQYCQYLKVIIDSILKKSEGILNLQEKQIIFSNIEQIYDLNLQFLKLFSQNHEENQKKFYDEWLELSHYFQIYFQYINDQPEGQKLREQMKNNNHKFTKTFEQYDNTEEFMNLNMESLFIKPLQKLINYELLLNNMIKKLSKKDEFYNIVKKLYDQFKELNQKCNDQIIKKQTQQELGYLQNIFNQEEILIPSRQFLQKEEIYIINGIHQKMINLYVCSDCIIVIQLKKQNNKKIEKFKFLLSFDINTFILPQKQKKYLFNAFQLCSGQGCFMFSCISLDQYKNLMDVVQNAIDKYVKNIQQFAFQINSKFIQPVVKQIQEKYPLISLIQPNRQYIFNQEIIFSLKNKYFRSNCYFFQDMIILFEPDQNFEIIKTFNLNESSYIVNIDTSEDEIFSFQIKTNNQYLTIINESIQDQLELMKKIQNDIIKYLNKQSVIVSVRCTIVRFNQLYYHFVIHQKHKFQVLYFTFEQIKDIHKQYRKKYPQIKLPDFGKDSQYEWSLRLIDQNRKIKFQSLFQFILTHEKSIKDYQFVLSLIPLNREFYQNQMIFDEQIECLQNTIKLNTFGIQNIKFKQLKDDFRIFSNLQIEQEQYTQQKIYLINNEFINVNICKNTSVLNVIQQFGLQKDLQSFLDFKLYMKFKSNNQLYQLDYDEKIESLKTYSNQQFQFLIKKYLQLPIEIENTDFNQNKEKLNIFLLQIHYNTMNLNYKLSQEQYLNYAALQIYLKYFMQGNFQIDDKLLNKVIQEYIPKKIFIQREKSYWKNCTIQIVQHLKQKFQNQKKKTPENGTDRGVFQMPDKGTDQIKFKPHQQIEKRSKSNIQQFLDNIVKILTPSKNKQENNYTHQRTKSQLISETQMINQKNKTQFEIQKQLFKEISRAEYFGYSQFSFKIDKSPQYYQFPQYKQDNVILLIGFQNILIISPIDFEKLIEIQYLHISSFFHDSNYIQIDFKQIQNDITKKQTIKLETIDFYPDTQEPSSLCFDYIKIREIIHQHRNQYKI